MRKHQVCALVLSSVAAVVACNGSTLDAGEDYGIEDYPTYHWSGEPSHSFGVPCVREAPPSVAGTWIGEFEEHTFPSGSRAIRIVIEGVSDSEGLCGHVIFGSGEPPPIPSSAEADYAPGLPEDASYYKNSVRNRRDPVEGFAYEFGRMPSNGTEGDGTFPEVPDPMMGFGIDLSMNQPYKAWCNLQTSYELPEEDRAGKFTCFPFQPYGYNSEGCTYPAHEGSLERISISCTKATLCFDRFFCDCSTEGCTVVPGLNSRYTTIQFDGDLIAGSIDIEDDPGIPHPLPFHLTRSR